MHLQSYAEILFSICICRYIIYILLGSFVKDGQGVQKSLPFLAITDVAESSLKLLYQYESVEYILVVILKLLINDYNLKTPP